MRHVLVVANKTVGGDELAAVIKERLAHQPCDFHLLVPVPPAPPIGIAAGFSAMEAGVVPTLHGPDERELAEERLRYGLEWMRGLGASVTGEVGESEAVRAVRGRARFDTHRRDHHLHVADDAVVLAAPGPSLPRRAQVLAARHRRHGEGVRSAGTTSTGCQAGAPIRRRCRPRGGTPRR